MNQKRKIGKRIASLLLCMVMVLTMMPITAQAFTVIDNVEILGSLPLIVCGDKIDPQNIASNLSVSPTADYKINAAKSGQIDYFENGEWNTYYNYDHDIYTPGTYRLLLCLELKKPSNETGITFPQPGITFNGTACGKPTTWFGISDVAYVYINFDISSHLYFPRIGSEYIYYFDDVTHWKAECRCGARSNESEHQFEWAIEKEPSEVESGVKVKRCAVCKYVIERTTLEYHEHKWSDEWYHDDNYHWKECTICSKKSEKVKHSRIQTIYLRQPTVIEKGRKCTECLDCGGRYNYQDTTDYMLFEFGISGFHTPVCGETIDISKFFDEAKYSDSGKYQIYPSGQETFLARIDSQTTVAGNAKNYYYNDYMPESTYKVGDYRLCFTLKTADSGSEFINYKWYYTLLGGRVALANGGKINDKTVRAYMINDGPEADSPNYIETFYDFTVSHHFVNKECTGCHVKECVATGNHDFSKYVSNGNGTHKVVCKDCGAVRTGHEKDACSGGTATCKEKAKCSKCGQEYGTLAAHNPETVPNVSVSYRTHVQSIGWQNYVKDGKSAGTYGMAKRLEGINIKVEGNRKLGVIYTTHCQTYGWLPWSSNGDMNGTEGEAKRLEAIEIKLTGADKDKYDIYYRVHAQSYGWLDWAKNGAPAGTAGYGKRLEAIQIVVKKKGEAAPSSNPPVNEGAVYKDPNGGKTKAFYAKSGDSPIVNNPPTSNTDPVIPGENLSTVAYRTHVQSFGWQGWKFNGQMSGTSGMAKRLEGIEIKLTNKQYQGGITYRTHVQKYGWQSWRNDGVMAGTSGEAKRLEAIEIKLTGEMAKQYDVYYRVHAQSYGWLGWAKNGQSSGTAGYGKRLEGIQIVLVKKGDKAPSNTYMGISSVNPKPYIENTVK